MFETLKRLYLEGSIDNEKLQKAITLNWISEEQKQEIIKLKVIGNI